MNKIKLEISWDTTSFQITGKDKGDKSFIIVHAEGNDVLKATWQELSKAGREYFGKLLEGIGKDF